MATLNRKTTVCLTVVVTTLALGSCARSADEQKWYEHGYEFAGGVIDVDGVTGHDDVMEECRVNAVLLELDLQSGVGSAMRDGCEDAISDAR
jgi:hypothetical protein